MLKEHFKLRFEPFGATPDTRFLYLSPVHREAIGSLLYGIRSARGFTALIAPPGMGKTTLLFHVLQRVANSAKTAFLFQTLCSPETFLQSLLADLGIADESGDIARMNSKLNNYLLQQAKDGRQVVVVIDEAQNLDERVLELVRMLSNFETPTSKLMNVILSGQPQLAEKLTSGRLVQLRQRISTIARLAPFDADETREYINHRLRVAGASPDHKIFSKQAYTIIAEESGGIPRNINSLCFNAMSLACALKESQVNASMLGEALDDLDLKSLIPAEDDDNRSRNQSRPASWRLGLAAAVRRFAGAIASRILPGQLMSQAEPQDSVQLAPSGSLHRPESPKLGAPNSSLSGKKNRNRIQLPQLRESDPSQLIRQRGRP